MQIKDEKSQSLLNYCLEDESIFKGNPTTVFFAVLLLSCLFIPPLHWSPCFLKTRPSFPTFSLCFPFSPRLIGNILQHYYVISSVHDTMCQAVGLAIQRATGNTLGKMDPGYWETSVRGKERMALPRSLCSSYLFSAPSRLFLSFLTLPVPHYLYSSYIVRRRSGFIITHRKFDQVLLTYTYTPLKKLKKKKPCFTL